MPDNRLTGRRLRLGERPALPPPPREHITEVFWGRRPVEEGSSAAGGPRVAELTPAQFLDEIDDPLHIVWLCQKPGSRW
jgi:hypothetical protein